MGEWCDNIDVSIFDEHLDHVLVEHYHPFLNQIFHFLILLFIFLLDFFGAWEERGLRETIEEEGEEER